MYIFYSNASDFDIKDLRTLRFNECKTVSEAALAVVIHFPSPIRLA